MTKYIIKQYIFTVFSFFYILLKSFFPTLTPSDVYLSQESIATLLKDHKKGDELREQVNIEIEKFRSTNEILKLNKVTNPISFELEKEILEPFVIKWLSNLNLDLVMMKEYFHESLVLLKRRLSWDFEDILYTRVNMLKYSYKVGGWLGGF